VRALLLGWTIALSFSCEGLPAKRGFHLKKDNEHAVQ